MPYSVRLMWAVRRPSVTLSPSAPDAADEGGVCTAMVAEVRQRVVTIAANRPVRELF
ncbi:hypothetical protein ACFUTV_20495 [Streptomyces sp. NPDC057298]|uniref:hypothetical protein n=1 Tax=Streptomyces sp. NPDC057298 TaxID=3346091 RepID=UPI003644CA39